MEDLDGVPSLELFVAIWEMNQGMEDHILFSLSLYLSNKQNKPAKRSMVGPAR